MTPRGTIIVSGAIANKAGHGGEAWVRLNWVLGFRRLGFRVLFLEQLAGGSDTSMGAKYFRDVTERFGLADSAALIAEDGAIVMGVGRAQVLEFAAGAEALINISGHLTFQPVFERVRRRLYVDIDPGFTQFWTAQGSDGARLGRHDFFFTVGENIGSPECPIPTCGIEWRKTRPPIVLDAWLPIAGKRFEKFTTIASWRGPFGVVEFGGQTFGLKVHEFRKFIELPQRARLPFEIALNIHPADHKDLEALRSHGWQIADPRAVSGEPEAFRRYVQSSSAEFSVAQGIYVQTHSGWFSDRTAAYLASGKPALVQDTGGSVPAGEGLRTFRTFDEAVAGAEHLAADYARHCRAARELAEAYFDSDKVLGRLLGEIDF